MLSIIINFTEEKTNRVWLVHFKSILMAFCTYVTEMGRSLRVQIQLAVTPGPHHTQYLTYKPRPCPPPPEPARPHRGIVDCAIWRNILLLWLQWQRNAHYIYQTARECSKKKKNKNKTGTISGPITEWREASGAEPHPPNPTTSCAKTSAPTSHALGLITPAVPPLFLLGTEVN